MIGSRARMRDLYWKRFREPHPLEPTATLMGVINYQAGVRDTPAARKSIPDAVEAEDLVG